MKTKQLSLWAGAALLGLSSFSAQASIELFDYGFNVDGSSTFLQGTVSFTSNPWAGAPSGVNIGGFNTTTGLGTITTSITGAGSHYFGAFFDHEIDESTNTFFNEEGSASGTPAAGQSWELDDPFFEDIQFYLSTSNLSNFNWLTSPDDVSMAMAWDFSLAIDEVATIEFLISEIMPASGFFLTHHDPDSSVSIYLSSSLDILPIPEPSILFLFGAGLAGFGLVAVRRRRFSVA